MVDVVAAGCMVVTAAADGELAPRNFQKGSQTQRHLVLVNRLENAGRLETLIEREEGLFALRVACRVAEEQPLAKTNNVETSALSNAWC